MMKKCTLIAVSIAALASTVCVDANAITRRASNLKASAGLAAVCPKIATFNPSLMFWKNNKPRRAGSAINSPVVGYYTQMTLGYNAGRRGALGNVLYDSNGNRLTTMTSYACRSDHCGGRVVSSSQTGATRRAAISATRSPSGYVPIGGRTCVKIEDIGRCYGNEVNKSRPLCNQVVG